MNIVHVGGAKGVGKTTVLKQLRNDFGENKKVNVLFSSGELNAISTSVLGKTLRELMATETRQVQDLLLKQIKNSAYSTVLLDSHYVDVTHEKIIALTPLDHERQFNCHIVLEADPHTILNRRINDNRTDRLLDLPTIATEINEERNEALKLAKRNGARIYIINASATTTEVVSSIKSILRDEFGI